MTTFAQAAEKAARRLRWLPVIAAIAAVMTATPLAWDSKNFGTFVLVISVYLPVLALVVLGLCIWAGVERKSPRARSIVISLVIMLTLIGGTFWAVPPLKDELRFLSVSLTHNDALRGFADKDAIILDWESWGMIGMENDAYLVSNPSDSLAEAVELRSGSATSDRVAKSLFRNKCVVESLSSRLTIVRFDEQRPSENVRNFAARDNQVI
ncbi:hypothetical protein ABIG06_004134 [Bradyrhizobium sp. USDA 326]|uniref:hypothetical protein n=1 Tax=unclassified Bradyrhizobium TaxID=2631580 RepID=UPI003517D04A